MTKLFVGNLPFSATDQELGNAFAAFGSVTSASVIMDRNTGRSRGFGFVEMENDEEAQKAVAELNNSDMGGRNIVVSVARPKEDRPAGDRGGDRGGFRGGRGGRR
ncbi:MAG TPA: RNA-binding protein [Patescibacteria group bacterium]